jgi:hypothetical protein
MLSRPTLIAVLSDDSEGRESMAHQGLFHSAMKLFKS